MEPSGTVMEGVVLTSKGIPTRIKDAPFSAEFISPGTILNLPTTSAYDALAYKKAFDLTSSSLTFKTPSTRGFNGSGSTRVNQLVDGMDNQAPGLNFFVGNFAGITELDNESIELLPGASSALYLSLIHISEPTRLLSISYAVFCLKKKKIISYIL